jgi:hypothetical protein
MDNANEHDELERQAPTLFSLPKADPFVVPTGFFDRFPHEVQALVTEEREAPSPGWVLWKRLALAVSVIALGWGAFWWLRPTNTIEAPIAEVQLHVISDEALDNLDDSELQSLAEVTSAEEAIGPGTVDLQLNDDELLAYLQHENTDLNELITDLQ